jgi:hypothetical protein
VYVSEENVTTFFRVEEILEGESVGRLLTACYVSKHILVIIAVCM